VVAKVVRLPTAKPLPDAELWHLVGAAEKCSEHPLASAIVAHAQQVRGVPTAVGPSKAGLTYPLRFLRHELRALQQIGPSSLFRYQASSFDAVVGKGIVCELAPVAAPAGSAAVPAPACARARVVVGNERFIAERCDGALLSPEHAAQRLVLEQEGHTVVLVAVDGVPTAMVAMADEVRPAQGRKAALNEGYRHANAAGRR